MRIPRSRDSLLIIKNKLKKLTYSDKEAMEKLLKIHEKAVQEYIYFLLRDVYLDKKDFLQEVKDRILKGRKLNFCNALLLKTMSSSRVTKKIIHIGVRGYKYISHQVNFGLAKYFGIV